MAALTNSQGSKYTDMQRRQAAIEYAIHGSMAEVSRITLIPEPTLCDWKKCDWWEPTVEELRTETKDLIDSGLQKLVVSGFESMQDRITNGDYYLTKGKDEEGRTVDVVARKPASLRDLTTASGVAYDKLRLHRNQPTSIKAESTDQRLADLAQKVRDLQGGMTVIDGKTGEIEDGK